MRLLLREHIHWSLPGLGMDAYIGDALQPQHGGRIDGTEVGQFQAVQEVLFHIANSIFHPSLFPTCRNIASRNREAAVPGIVKIALVKNWRATGQMFDDAGLQIMARPRRLW